jgi:hypothetical protein
MYTSSTGGIHGFFALLAHGDDDYCGCDCDCDCDCVIIDRKKTLTMGNNVSPTACTNPPFFFTMGNRRIAQSGEVPMDHYLLRDFAGWTLDLSGSSGNGSNFGLSYLHSS